jgi:Inorganic pyrophosphatase
VPSRPLASLFRSTSSQSLNLSHVEKAESSLADPTSLNPRSDDTFQVIIETPKASRNKYSYDPEQGIFTLRKVLPEGMVFPYDFGFLPRTHSRG